MNGDSSPIVAALYAIVAKLNPTTLFQTPTELTISSGEVTATRNFHTIDTESNAASDDLSTIAGGSVGRILFIRAESDARTVVVKHNTGDIWFSNGADVSLDDIRDGVLLIHDGTKWLALGVGADLSTVVLKALFDANTILTANTDDTPAALTVAQQRLVGRITAGNIAALTATQVRTLISVENGATADQTEADILTLLGLTSVEVDQVGNIGANLITASIWAQIANMLATTISAAQWAILGARTAPYVEFNFPAGSWNYPTANPAPLDRDVGTNGGMFRNLFNDTTEEFLILEPAFEIPDSIDTAGTVYFSLFGYAVAADGNEVQFRVSHSAKDEGESWDAAYGTKDSGDKATDADQDEIDQIEWNETVSNLGWTAQDLIRLMISRIAIADGTKVTGDYGFLNLKIRIPVT